MTESWYVMVIKLNYVIASSFIHRYFIWYYVHLLGKCLHSQLKEFLR